MVGLANYVAKPKTGNGTTRAVWSVCMSEHIEHRLYVVVVTHN